MQRQLVKLAGKAVKLSRWPFGKLGIVVENPNLSINDVSTHGLNQSITRGLASSTILNTIRNPTAVLQQNGGTYLYLTKHAAVVLNTKGKMVTTYPASMFDKNILDVLNRSQQ